jgi:hypothetical protein
MKNQAVVQGHSWHWAWRNDSNDLVLQLIFLNLFRHTESAFTRSQWCKSWQCGDDITRHTIESKFEYFFKKIPSACNPTYFTECVLLRKMIWSTRSLKFRHTFSLRPGANGLPSPCPPLWALVLCMYLKILVGVQTVCRYYCSSELLAVLRM